MMKLPRFLFAIISLLVSVANADDRPNFVFFITDDISAEDLGCYGNAFVETPHLDALAERGMRFNQAYLTISSCSPSRCSIISSRYPHNTGAPELHTSLPDDQVRFPKLLRDAGYYTVLSGKNHIAPLIETFESISKGRGPSKSEDWVDLLANRPRDKPFFAWFGSSDAHRGWAIDDKNATYDPAEIEVPPYLYDGAATRDDLADYYHEVSRTDTFMSKLIKELKRQGIEDNTYVIYMTDNGRPFPRCKTRLYDSGIKSPFLITCPGKVSVGVTESIISSIDVGPTILELAGVEADDRMQGVSFAKILNDPEAVTREVAFAEHNWHVYQAHMRMVRFGDFLYIKNSFPDRQAMCIEADPTFPSGAELWEKHEEGKLNANQIDIFLNPRPARELYHVGDDPDQLTNLAENPEYAHQIAKMQKVLDQWSKETGDTVPDNPTPDRGTVAGKRNPHREFPGAATGADKINAKGPVMLN